MTAILNWLDSVLSRFLSADIYTKLDQLYIGTIFCLGAGIILMLLAVVFMILAVRRSKKSAVQL